MPLKTQTQTISYHSQESMAKEEELQGKYLEKIS